MKKEITLGILILAIIAFACNSNHRVRYKELVKTYRELASGQNIMGYYTLKEGKITSINQTDTTIINYIFNKPENGASEFSRIDSVYIEDSIPQEMDYHAYYAVSGTGKNMYSLRYTIEVEKVKKDDTIYYCLDLHRRNKRK